MGEGMILPVEAFEQRLKGMAGDRRPLLIFDQFEEFYTLFEEAPRKDALRDALRAHDHITEILSTFINDNDAPYKFLFVFREDYLAKLTKLFQLCPDLPDHYLRLTPLDRDAAREAIVKPITKYNEFHQEHDENYQPFEFDEHLVNHILDELEAVENEEKRITSMNSKQSWECRSRRPTLSPTLRPIFKR